MAETNIFQRLPALAVVIVCAILGIEIVFQLGAAGVIGGVNALAWRVEAITRFGFADPLFDHLRVNGGLMGQDLFRFVSYGLIHHNLVHAVFGSVLVLALGKVVSAGFSSMAIAVLMMAGQVAGALAYGLVLETKVALIGVYPAVYGLIGAYTWMLFQKAEGRSRLMAFRLVGVLVTLQLIFQLLIGGSSEWVAYVAAFAAGFSLSYCLGPGAGQRLRAYLRWTRQR